MDWDLILQNSLASLFGSAAIGAIGVVVVRHFLSRDLERHRLNLQAASDRELERLKAEYRVLAFEAETRFARLHERRIQVLVELYQEIVNAEGAMSELVQVLTIDDTAPEEKKRAAAAEAVNALVRQSETSRIFIDSETSGLVETFIAEAKAAWFLHRRESVTPKPSLEEWRSKVLKVEKMMPELRKSIEGEFRKILGVR
jgi:hypothetical protein